ncbi:MAG: hypothetical protein BEN19_07775 [Epulopiscium sp. Nuni2H_MBin003]|nr:MAG: hypothetical protein BEN19_07775 [Epulopiscium sp. Nuni2H_MBin003]
MSDIEKLLKAWGNITINSYKEIIETAYNNTLSNYTDHSIIIIGIGEKADELYKLLQNLDITIKGFVNYTNQLTTKKVLSYEQIKDLSETESIVFIDTSEEHDKENAKIAVRGILRKKYISFKLVKNMLSLLDVLDKKEISYTKFASYYNISIAYSVSTIFMRNQLNQHMPIIFSYNTDTLTKLYSGNKIIICIQQPVVKDINLTFFANNWAKQWLDSKKETKDVDIAKIANTPIPELFSDVINNPNLSMNTVISNFCNNVLDIMSFPFDKQRGYSIINHKDIEIFIYQNEKTNHIITPLCEWLDLSDIVVNTKFWEESIEKGEFTLDECYKGYFQLKYKIIENGIKLTPEYIEEKFNEPYVTHFYSSEDIAEYKKMYAPVLI